MRHVSRPLERNWFTWWSREKYDRELARYRREQAIALTVRIAVALAIVALALYVVYLFTVQPAGPPIEPGSAR